jgi:multisubunit Na+/H+ antiporter MnhB subunit
LGFLALGITGIGIAIIAILLAEPIEKLFYSLGFWQLVEYRDLLLLLSIGIAFPFLAVLFIGVPTGKILQKFENRQITIENKDEELPETNLATD